MKADRISAIFQAFDSPADVYRRAEVDEALTLQKVITPPLLAVLDELAANPEEFSDKHTLLHMYAVSLLAHFKEPRAHLPIIRAFNLPPRIEYRLWAEMTTEMLPVLLFQTCGGKVDAIKELVLDTRASETVRTSAMDALTLGALEGVVPREDVLAFFGGLFTGTEADRSSDFFWTGLASAASDLWPREILPALKKAYDDGLISEDSIPWADIEESVAAPMKDWLARERERAGLRIPADAHDYLAWLDCFEAEQDAPRTSRTDGDQVQGGGARRPSPDLPRQRATDASPENIARIIQGFDTVSNEYREGEVDEAVALREAITPRLIAVLEEFAASPERFEEQHRGAHLYAATLLAHFREPRAHLPLIKAFTVDQASLRYWGDTVTEDLDRLLFMTCDGKVDHIKALILDKSAHHNVRIAAALALNLAVLNGVYPREDAIKFYGGLFTGTEAEPSSPFWSMLTSAVTRIYPEELLPTIKKAYQDGLVYPGYIGLEDVEETIREGKDDTLAGEKRLADERIHENVHDYMSGWACFDSEQDPALRAARRNQREDAERQARQRARDKQKAKKKAAKKAKKKNRR